MVYNNWGPDSRWLNSREDPQDTTKIPILGGEDCKEVIRDNKISIEWNNLVYNGKVVGEFDNNTAWLVFDTQRSYNFPVLCTIFNKDWSLDKVNIWRDWNLKIKHLDPVICSENNWWRRNSKPKQLSWNYLGNMWPGSRYAILRKK